jgi:hypothetical protein
VDEAQLVKFASLQNDIRSCRPSSNAEKSLIGLEFPDPSSLKFENSIGSSMQKLIDRKFGHWIQGITARIRPQIASVPRITRMAWPATHRLTQ